jgi:hypothetical protein
MLSAAVPETPIHKNRKLLFTENEIRAAGQSSMPAPTDDFVLAQQAQESQFCDFVATTPHGAHNFRAPLF